MKEHFKFHQAKTEIGSSRNGSELTDFTFFHKIQTTVYFTIHLRKAHLSLSTFRSHPSLIKNELYSMDLNPPAAVTDISHLTFQISLCFSVSVRKSEASGPSTMISHFVLGEIDGLRSDLLYLETIQKKNGSVHTVVWLLYPVT